MSDPYGSIAVADPYAGIGAPKPKPAKPAEPPATLGGVAAAGGSGLLNGLLSLSPEMVAHQGEAWGSDLVGALAKQLGVDPEVVDRAIGQVQAARRQAAPTATEAQQAAHLYHAPVNEPERIADLAGRLAPAAIVPETLPAKIAAVAVPTITGEGSRAVVQAAGGGPIAQGIAQAVGAGVGGLATGVRVGGAPEAATAPEVPTGVDPANPVSAPVARQAAAYVASRAGNTDPAMVAAQAAGKPVMAAETLGGSGRTALAALARRPGATGDALGPALGERTAATPARMQGDFQAATGISPEAVQGDMEALIEARRQGPVKAAYDAALANKPDMEVSGGGAQSVTQLMAEPEVKTAFGFAQRKLGSAAIDPSTGNPTAEALDLTKKYLGQMVKRDPITKQPITTGPEGIGNQFTMDTAKAFTQALRKAIPGYGDALDQAGDYLGLQRAHDLGAKMVLSPNSSVADVTKQLAGLSEAESEAFKGGIAAKLFSLSENGRLSPKTVATPGVVGKLRAALGPKGAQQFLTGAAQEKLMADQARRMAPGTNSPTAELTAEMGAQDAQHPLAKAGAEFARDTAVGTAATLGNVAVAAKIAALRQIGKAASGVAKNAMAGAYGMPQAVRDEAGRILMSEMTPEQVRAYTALARGQQDKALRIVLANPKILERPTFLAAAAAGFSAGRPKDQPAGR